MPAAPLDPTLREELDAATEGLEPPFAVVRLDAFDANAADLERRAAGKPIRLASKSVRCRALQGRTLARAGWRGTLCFTLPEALWLAAQGEDDLLVAYPTVDDEALGALARLMTERPEARIAVTVDSEAHLEMIATVAVSERSRIRVCLDLDSSLRLARGRVSIGARRSPLHAPAQAALLARTASRRRELRVVGVMAYEAQIAGVGDRPPGRPLRGAAIRAMQRLSRRELADRRAELVAAVETAIGRPLELVNGGGTGSLESTAAEAAVTELAAGSGLYGPWLFDGYGHFTPRPAALFALPVVRKPSPDVATVLGGGYVASGAAGPDRLPQPYLPPGLRLDATEGAGEVQTPLLGESARDLRIGDRVWFRHAKAGELCERFDRLYLVEGGRIVDAVPTYRGEGRCFL